MEFKNYFLRSIFFIVKKGEDTAKVQKKKLWGKRNFGVILKAAAWISVNCSFVAELRALQLCYAYSCPAVYHLFAEMFNAKICPK